MNAVAELPNPPRAGRIEGRATYSYYSTESNFSSTGAGANAAAGSLVRDGSLTQMKGDFVFTYDWQPDWRFSLGANVAYVESDDGLYARSNSGMNEGYLSAQKWFESGPFDIAPQVDLIFPFWSPDIKSDEALIGEGALRARGGIWAVMPFDAYRPFIYAGYEYRDGGRSFLIPYEAGLKIRLPSFWVQASYRGFETVVNDSDTNNLAVREAYLRTVNAGSLKFYSVNPSGSEGAVEAGFNIGSIGVHGGFAMNVTGDNYADGWTGYAGLSWSPEMQTERRRVNDGFNIRKEQYDESLFREEAENPPAPMPSVTEPPNFMQDPNLTEPVREATPLKPPLRRRPLPPEERPAAPPPPARPSRPVDLQLELRPAKPKKKPNRRPKKNLDQMMNDAEKSLEQSH